MEHIYLPRLVLAGAHSNVGKTTLTLALMGALRQKGLTVQPFKVGPDYIDPVFHTIVTGRPSYNLDAWLVAPAFLATLFQAKAPPAKTPESTDCVSIIEGVMGLFDGVGQSAFASTAHVAALLKSPVLLAVNAEGLALSVAALVSGYANFQPHATSVKASPDAPSSHFLLEPPAVSGIILNRVSGERHYQLLKDCIENNTGIPCFGYLPKNAAPSLPSRHLGLVPAREISRLDAIVSALVQGATHTLDIEGILATARNAPPLPEYTPRDTIPLDRQAWHPSRKARPSARRLPLRIGVACDRAFSFYYQDNFDLLPQFGAEPVFFSPLKDKALPQGLHGVYLGGGFPEMFAPQLETNALFRQNLCEALENGLPAYAECGGMLFLCRSLTISPPKGPARCYAMTGFFPDTAAMDDRLQQPFGYLTLTLREDCLLGRAGATFRAHSFHYSRLSTPKASPFCACRTQEAVRRGILLANKPGGAEWTEGLARKNVLAAYPHLYFLGCPETLDSFLDVCAQYQASQEGLL